MSLATALVTGNEPLPLLAETAVAQALARAGLTTANSVLLFLTPDFSRVAQACVTAAARAASCLQVAGGIAAGVFTEHGAVLDRPAAAVMVLGGAFSLIATDEASAKESALLSFAGGAMPPHWQNPPPRFGASFKGGIGHGEPAAWQAGRLTNTRSCTLAISGGRVDLGISSGLRLIGTPHGVDAARGYDLHSVGGCTALTSLLRALGSAGNDVAAASPQACCAVLIDDNHPGDAPTALAAGRFRPLPIVVVNADESLTLTEHVRPGQRLAWAIREPSTSAADMRHTLDRLAADSRDAKGALLFSCIGRGPYFYGGEDTDLALFAEYFPGLPLLGVYGTAQIAPGCAGSNRQLRHGAVAALLADH
ncbi:hypothetical protein GH865_00530 [Rhodocyclus tenuis]|uniref:FIST C-terminal domain-containing protein n=1 Tax=Rhodocyclus gracilis TaxID=2929842 RepID=UPI001298E2CA|nr:FIST C-terminal domain-containing protein [Rhodocyclus gracilis]MRD71744.1 hypothetical protein [Rhodocyclus gracilis]